MQGLSGKTTSQLWQEVGKLRRKPYHKTYAEPESEAQRICQELTTRGDVSRLPKVIQDIYNAEEGTYLQEIRDGLLGVHDTNTPFMSGERQEALEGRHDTAPGGDGLQYVFYCKLGPLAKNWLLATLNKLYEAAIWPEDWKTAVMIPLPKSGGPGIRPISLLECLSKVAEVMILNRVKHVVDPREYT